MDMSKTPQPDEEHYELLAILDITIDHLSQLNLDYALTFLQNHPITLVKPTADLTLYPTIWAPGLSPKLPRNHSWNCGSRQIIIPGPQSLRSEASRLKLIMKGNAMAQCRPFLLTETSLSPLVPMSNSVRDSLDHKKLVAELLTTSQHTGVPLISCICNPEHTDLITLSTTLMVYESDLAISDAELLHPFMKPYDRTQVFVHSLGSNLELGFTYLKLHHELVPARVEFPMWLYETGELNSILHLIVSSKFLGIYDASPSQSSGQNFTGQKPAIAQEEP